MVGIEFKPGGTQLAKVLASYGFGGEIEGAFESTKIVCPFHDDINASMLVDFSQGRFYCFGCNVHGNAVDFVRYANPKLDDLEVLHKYWKIQRNGKYQKFENKSRVVSKVKRQQNKKHLLTVADDYYTNLLTIDWEDESNPLTYEVKQYMLKRGFVPSSLNLCKAKLTYNEGYPIIFPMYDMGVFKGWVCRTMDPEIQKKRKYLYNKGFSRSDTLVGDYKNKTVVLVEGYMDYLKMLQNGQKHVAAILGWKITSQQITKLKAVGVKQIISALDADECGIKGTEYLTKFFPVIRFQFPEGIKDPGEMDRKTFEGAKIETKKKTGGIVYEYFSKNQR